MIDLPSDTGSNNLIQWVINNPDEYTLYTYNYTSTNNGATYTQYYFILNTGYETHITTQEFTDSPRDYIKYFVNTSGGKDKNYLTIMPPIQNTDSYGIALGSKYTDVRLVMCFSPTAGQVFTITNNKLTNYTATSTGFSNDPDLRDFTLDGKQYSYTGYDVNDCSIINSNNKYIVLNVHDYKSRSTGLSRQPLGTIRGILVSNTDVAIGDYIKVPFNTARKLLAYGRDSSNTVYDVLSRTRFSAESDDIVTTYKASNNTMYARLDTLYESGYRDIFRNEFNLYDIRSYAAYYAGSGTEPGVDIEDFVRVTSDDMNTIIVSSGVQQLRGLVSELTLNNMHEGASTQDIRNNWASTILNIIASAIPDLMDTLPKLTQVTQRINYPILDATVYDSTTDSTVTYSDFLNSYIASDDFVLHMTLNDDISYDYNTTLGGYGMLAILTVLGFFNPSSTKSVTIMKGQTL